MRARSSLIAILTSAPLGSDLCRRPALAIDRVNPAVREMGGVPGLANIEALALQVNVPWRLVAANRDHIMLTAIVYH